MTRTFKALALAAALVAVPSLAQAQATLGPQIAYHNDFDFGVGAALTLSADAIHEQVDFLFDFVWFFPEVEGIDVFELNGGLLYDFILDESTVTPFALAGLNLASFSFDAPGVDNQTELGLNLGGGLKFNAGTLRPMVGVRLELEGGDGFVIFGTIPFNLQGS